MAYIYLGNKLIAKDGIQPASQNSRQHYKPFGETIEAPKDEVGYTGHKYDKDLGLNYMQARYYDPTIGRFYSNDPIGYRDLHSFNRYAYVNNNPFKYVDPDGQEVISVYANTNNTLFMADKDTHAWALVQAESGGKPFGDPIPAGNYSILERAGRDGFYRLEGQDSNFGDDATADGRTHLRLHGPGRTLGCVSVCTNDGFKKVEKLLQSTSKSTTKVDDKSILGRLLGRQESLTNFGSMQVLPSGFSLNFDAPTGQISISRTQTGSRIPRKTVICSVREDGGCN
ncbi:MULTISPECIES: RHS repeat-associated core domain-containing protein [unclassified Microbulbifer]|uniref:RHS repeat-associated core domain-containing protein n=1 Tax=unclassified Microbulbifer TaxID=2619833 RepID=UPI0027E4ADB9|nr:MULTISPECIES: RHS repeat-associated core domain-containing protein [unclassified Microbulbifer]